VASASGARKGRLHLPASRGGMPVPSPAACLRGLAMPALIFPGWSAYTIATTHAVRRAVKEGALSSQPAVEFPRVIVVMPAYNAARTLERTYADLPKEIVDQVILVDDVSQDDTVEVARRLGIEPIIHIQNRGYGGNQKTCYVEALTRGADIVVMLHPDYQYDSTLVPELIRPIIDGRADLVLGSRLLNGGALAGGMPFWKFVSNRFLTVVENLAFGLSLSEYHTGFRAYSRRLLETIPFVLNSDKFVFDSEVIAQTVYFGFQIAEIPVPTRYFKEASSVNLKNSVIYGVNTLRTVGRYLLNRWGLARSPQFNRQLHQVISRYHMVAIVAGRARGS
jgi:glycosyltransferase involved in cell wall biosynthesis